MDHRPDNQNPVLPPPDFTKVTPFTIDHVPRMLALTKQTNPGPFFQRTIKPGNYYGIFNGEQLVAMAEQRMHPGQYLEISAVCTHPDHHGNGYATTLMHFIAGNNQVSVLRSLSSCAYREHKGN